MQVGDLVRRRNNGDLAIVIEAENPCSARYFVAVLTTQGHKQLWYPVEFEVINGNR